MAFESSGGDFEGDHRVTAAELNRNFSAVQERAKRQPVIVTRHGRPRLAILSATHFDALRSRAGDGDGSARRKLVLMLDSIREGYISVDASLRIVTVNRVAEIFLGHTRDELAGKRWDEIFPDPAWAEMANRISRVIEHRKVVSLEVQLQLHASRTVELQVFPLPAPQGGAGVLFFNVSDTRRAEQLAKEAKDKVRALLALLDRHAVVGVTEDRRIAAWNIGAEAIFGWPEKEAVGQALAAIVPDPASGIFKRMTKLRDDGSCLRARQAPCRHKAGHALLLDAAITLSPGGWTMMFSQPEG